VNHAVSSPGTDPVSDEFVRRFSMPVTADRHKSRSNKSGVIKRRGRDP
jgi:hypothetical protein